VRASKLLDHHIPNTVFSFTVVFKNIRIFEMEANYMNYCTEDDEAFFFKILAPKKLQIIARKLTQSTVLVIIHLSNEKLFRTNLKDFVNVM
jgi:hypothetical protein